MLCRQVTADVNGIEQIYIIKPPNWKNSGCAEGVDVSCMEPEDVDEVKYELLSDNEDVFEGVVANELRASPIDIKEESDEDKILNSEDDTDETKRHSSSDLKAKVANTAPKYVLTSTQVRKNPNIVYKERATYKQYHRLLNVTQKTNATKQFVCKYCSKIFSSSFALGLHESCHNAIKAMVAKAIICRKKNLCCICQREHSTKEALTEHLRVHADMLPYTCNLCEEPVQIDSAPLLNQHFRLHEDPPQPTKCSYCSASFHSKSACLLHESEHVPGPQTRDIEEHTEMKSKKLNVTIVVKDGSRRYVCEHCNKTYSSLTSLRSHTKSHTVTRENLHICNTKTNSNALSRAQHEEFQSIIKPFKCDTCDKTFKNEDLLIEHKRKNTGDGPLLCICGSTFESNCSFKDHKQGVCKTAEIIDQKSSSICRFCQNCFPNYAELIRHVKEMHAKGMRKTKCTHCTKKFKDAVLLMVHEYRHQLPGVIKCNMCSRIFTRQRNLNYHMRLHSASEPFICEECGKMFKKYANLLTHVRIHTENRTYSCEFCSKTLYGSIEKRHHKRSHFQGATAKTLQEADKSKHALGNETVSTMV